MLPPMDTLDHILPGENAATGELEAMEPNFPRKAMDKASLTRRKKRTLLMIIRLGSNPRCEFVNGLPPPVPHYVISED